RPRRAARAPAALRRRRHHDVRAHRDLPTGRAARRDPRAGPPRMIFRRLLPEPGELEGAEAVAGLAGREVLAVNMVASADGRAAFGGVTAPLSDPADRELFHLLRAQADAILFGTGTLRTERSGRVIKDERLR